MIVQEDVEDGGYNISCTALPGCHSQGETIEEALTNIKDAICGCVEVRNEDTLRNKNSRIMEVFV